MIEQQLTNYQIEETIAVPAKGTSQPAYELRTAGDLWNSKSPFKYAPERQEEYQKVEPDIFERAAEFLKEPHKMRWTELNQFWFQENKHLHPRNRKHEWSMTAQYEGPIQQTVQPQEIRAMTQAMPQQPTMYIGHANASTGFNTQQPIAIPGTGSVMSYDQLLRSNPLLLGSVALPSNQPPAPGSSLGMMNQRVAPLPTNRNISMVTHPGTEQMPEERKKL